MQAYALKAAREGKQETSWLNPHEAYEAGLQTFIARILDRSVSAEFLDSLETLARRVALLGALNSLSQITLKATMPGVPDFYQGTEFWDLSLVDPDNRRPVDFAARAACWPTLETPDWDSLAQNWPDGHIKLAWTRHLLKLRTELADVFTRWRLPAAGGQRPASRPRHRFCAASWPRRRDRRGREIAAADVARRPGLAARGSVSTATLEREAAIPSKASPAHDADAKLPHLPALLEATICRSPCVEGRLCRTAASQSASRAVGSAEFAAEHVMHQLALGQQQITAIADRDLRDLGKSLQQPRQRHFQPHMIVGDIEMARRRLPQRAHAEDHAIVFPSLFVDLQHRNAGRRARQSRLQPAHRFFAAEADAESKRPAAQTSLKSSSDATACNSTIVRKEEAAEICGLKNGTL